MRSIYAAFILLLVLMTSAHCQQTAEDWFNKGDLLLNSGKYNESIEAYNKAIELNQSYAVAWSHKGDALLNLSLFNESLDSYDKAIKLDPNFALAECCKGLALYLQGKYDDAINYYRQAASSKGVHEKTAAMYQSSADRLGKHKSRIAKSGT